MDDAACDSNVVLVMHVILMYVYCQIPVAKMHNLLKWSVFQHNIY